MPDIVLQALPRPNALRRAVQLSRRFILLSWPDKAGLLVACTLLAMAAMALRLVHFRHLAPLLGHPTGPDARLPLANLHQEKRALFVKRAIWRAATIMPVRCDCLPQALTGAVYCRLLGVPATTHLGVKLGTDRSIAAHAWLCSGRIAVTGGYSFDEFVAVSCFTSR